MMSCSAVNDSYTYNENGRVASGLIYLRELEFSAFRVNPPLGNMVGAIPAFLCDAEHSTRARLGFSLFGRDEYKAGSQFIEKNSNHRSYLISGRICCITFSVIGGWFLFLWARELYGVISGYVASLLWVFSPYTLGFGGLICPDVPSAALGIVVGYFFWKWNRNYKPKYTFLLGVTLGIAELTKFTLLVFYPLILLLWSINGRKKPKELFFAFFLSLLIINMGYVFEGTGKSLGSYRFQTTFFTGCETLKEVPTGGGNRFRDTLLGKIPVPLPMNFVQGIDTQRLDFERGLSSYLRGEWSDHGWWHYYFYALLIKTPLGTLGLLLLAVYCTFFVKECNTSWRDEVVVLLPGIVLLVFVSSQTGFSIHSRYIIPALPFFFIWISKVGKAISWKRPALSAFISLLLAWSVFSSLWVYPHSISYFNELAVILPTPEDKNYPQAAETQKTFWQRAKYLLDAGPRNGPRHLLDSNIDWGQDLFNLEQWCQSHPEVKEMKVAYWGSYPLEMSKVVSTGMPLANDPQPGWYALSVNYIYDREKRYRYFLHFEPVATAGYSINIYHVTLEEANRIRQKMGLPELESSTLSTPERNVI